MYKVENSSATSIITTMFGTVYGELPTPTRANHDFKGWYLDSDYSTPVDANTAVTTAIDHTLYAKWELSNVNLSVLSNYSGSAGVTGAGVYKYGETVTVTADIYDSRFTFVEWQIGGETVSTSSVYQFEILQNTTIVAIYRLVYTQYEISHISQLFWIADCVATGYDFSGTTFDLTADLYLTYVTDQAWSTIGSIFAGIFKSNCFTIYYDATTNATLAGGTASHGSSVTLFSSDIVGTIVDLGVNDDISMGAVDSGGILNELPPVNNDNDYVWEDNVISKPR